MGKVIIQNWTITYTPLDPAISMKKPGVQVLEYPMSKATCFCHLEGLKSLLNCATNPEIPFSFPRKFKNTSGPGGEKFSPRSKMIILQVMNSELSQCE